MYDIPGMTADPAQLRVLQQALASGVSPLLQSVKIKLTSFCNLRCHMCHYWRTEREDSLSTEAWLSIMDQLAALGCRKIHFSGGEVFLRRDFLDLVERAASHKIKVNMTTNGTLLTAERVRRLVRARPNSISLSLDGARPKTHDRIRGIEGSFRRTTQTIRRIRRQGQSVGRTPKIRVNFVVQRLNYREMPRMVEVAAGLGACELHPMPVDEKGDRKNRLSSSQIRRYNEEVAPRVEDLRRQVGFSTDPLLIYPFGRTPGEIKSAKQGLYSLGFYQRHPCLAPWLHLFIGWDGECYLCCMTNRRMESIGNVARQGVEAVFNGPAMQAVRARFLAGQMEKSCGRCDMFLGENLALHTALKTFEQN